MSLMESPPMVAAQDASEALDGPRFTRRVTLLTMLSVLLVMLLSSLDQTIVGTAMPRVVVRMARSERHDLHYQDRNQQNHGQRPGVYTAG